jgi:transposase-like protein
MDCPRCKSPERVKNGKVNNLQRYKCKNCGFNFTVSIKSTIRDSRLKRFALTLYLEGLGFHTIGRILGVSHVAVIKWVNKFGNKLNEIRIELPVEIKERDKGIIKGNDKIKKRVQGIELVEQENLTIIQLSINNTLQN